MNLIINPSDSIQEMTNQALEIAKSKPNLDVCEILNDLMSEIKWGMTENQYKDFQDRINILLNE